MTNAVLNIVLGAMLVCSGLILAKETGCADSNQPTKAKALMLPDDFAKAISLSMSHGSKHLFYLAKDGSYRTYTTPRRGDVAFKTRLNMEKDARLREYPTPHEWEMDELLSREEVSDD
jgi:hypothetical protein